MSKLFPQRLNWVALERVAEQEVLRHIIMSAAVAEQCLSRRDLLGSGLDLPPDGKGTVGRRLLSGLGCGLLFQARHSRIWGGSAVRLPGDEELQLQGKNDSREYRVVVLTMKCR